VSEKKTGTQYVREMCETFRGVAEKTKFQAVNEKFLSLTDELEPITKKLYFKTPKGTEDVIELVAELEELKAALDECEEADAAMSMCNPFYEKIEKLIKKVKTMKVRMT